MANLLDGMGSFFKNDSEEKKDVKKEGSIASENEGGKEMNGNMESSNVSDSSVSAGTVDTADDPAPADSSAQEGSFSASGETDSADAENILAKEAAENRKESEAEKSLKEEMGGVREGAKAVENVNRTKIPENFKRTNLVVCAGRIIRVETDWMGRGCAVIDVPVTVAEARRGDGEENANAEARTVRTEPYYPAFSVPIGSDNEQFLRFGSNVKITGHIEAFDRYDRLNDRYIYSQTFIADKVEPVLSEMEDVFGVKGRWISTRYFRIYLGGEVYRLRDMSPSFGSLTLEVPGVGVNQMDSRIHVDYYKGFGSSLPPFRQIHARRMASENGRRRIAERGDFVYCSASLHVSRRHAEGGRVNTFENIRIDEISILGNEEDS